jgi:hypothetical protein
MPSANVTVPTGVLRVEMIQPSVCAAVTTVYTFTRG